MDLDELRAFVAVVETGSIVAGARSLNFARATLRRRLDELEARAGVPLLHRTAHGVTPTEAGSVLAARGRRILQEASALLSSVREVGAEPTGELRFMVPVGLPPEGVTSLFAALRTKYPHLSLRVHFSEDPLGGLLEDVDVAVHFGTRSPAGSWVSYELLRVRERLIASREYLRRKGVPKTLDELAHHDLLAWDCPDGDATIWPTWQGTTLRVVPRVISPDIHLLRRCAAAGMGIAFLPDAEIPESDAPADGLVPVLPNDIGRERPLRVVVPAVLAEIPRIRAVLTEIRAFLARVG
ncbi:MAG: LysR family transcriptional regulator [Myxococcales bacterium SG8_38]|nr:MAG: LysR family transcriptional regulator [Myxococcales bacterium SG8_38]